MAWRGSAVTVSNISCKSLPTRRRFPCEFVYYFPVGLICSVFSAKVAGSVWKSDGIFRVKSSNLVSYRFCFLISRKLGIKWVFPCPWQDTLRKHVIRNRCIEQLFINRRPLHRCYCITGSGAGWLVMRQSGTRGKVFCHPPRVLCLMREIVLEVLFMGSSFLTSFLPFSPRVAYSSCSTHLFDCSPQLAQTSCFGMMTETPE